MLLVEKKLILMLILLLVKYQYILLIHLSNKAFSNLAQSQCGFMMQAQV